MESNFKDRRHVLWTDYRDTARALPSVGLAHTPPVPLKQQRLLCVPYVKSLGNSGHSYQTVPNYGVNDKAKKEVVLGFKDMRKVEKL